MPVLLGLCRVSESPGKCGTGPRGGLACAVRPTPCPRASYHPCHCCRSRLRRLCPGRGGEGGRAGGRLPEPTVFWSLGSHDTSGRSSAHDRMGHTGEGAVPGADAVPLSRVSLAGSEPSLVQAALGQAVRLSCPGDTSRDLHTRWQKDGQPISSDRCVQSPPWGGLSDPLWGGRVSVGPQNPGAWVGFGLAVIPLEPRAQAPIPLTEAQAAARWLLGHQPPAGRGRWHLQLWQQARP